MKEAVTKVIDMLIQEDFYGAFKRLLERYNKCIAAGGDYILPIQKKSGNLLKSSHKYIYIYIYIYYYEEIRHYDTFHRQWTIVVSKNYKIVAVKEALSLSHPLYHYKVRYACEELTLY